jgi:enoyl-CoA hydratase
MLPRNIAYEMALTGDPITAERGHDFGLVNRLSEPGEALETALTVAAAIGANGPLALKASKRILRESADWPDSEYFALQETISGPVFNSQDAAEGATAFAEKRAPVWRGV